MSVSQANETVALDNPYRKAKIEHYLNRVEELILMARYGAAQKTLSHVYSLDPNSKSGHVLAKQIEAALDGLLPNSAMAYAGSNGVSRSLRRGELVLVVDQDERTLVSLVRSLQRYGFSAMGAAGFEEARDILSRHKPVLIISEVNFENGPVGYDLYLWVRHNEALGATPFLYLATRVTREMLIAGKRMGVDEFIVKPLDEEVVMASILNCLARRKKKVA